jgi:hypothetical protein
LETEVKSSINVFEKHDIPYCPNGTTELESIVPIYKTTLNKLIITFISLGIK